MWWVKSRLFISQAPCHALIHHFRIANNGIQWGAQFMGHFGQKLAFAGIRFFCRFAGFLLQVKQFTLIKGNAKMGGNGFKQMNVFFGLFVSVV